MFVEKTTDILGTSEFLRASPETVEAIFKQENTSVDSEMDFVRALERYIEHHKESDPEITKKIRPALNCIRFLTLAPGDLARTKLLTPVEMRDVIICQTSKDDLFEMPLGFSLNKNQRGNIAITTLLGNTSIFGASNAFGHEAKPTGFSEFEPTTSIFDLASTDTIPTIGLYKNLSKISSVGSPSYKNDRGKIPITIPIGNTSVFDASNAFGQEAQPTGFSELESTTSIFCFASTGTTLHFDNLSPLSPLNEYDGVLLSGLIEQKKGTIIQKIMQALYKIYSSEICGFCTENHNVITGHAIWNCREFHHFEKTNLEAIYKKYGHIRLFYYTEEDVHAIFKSYQRLGLIKESVH